MPATVIAERVGWTRGITVFKERVAELRPAYLPPDPASRTTYVAGEIAQCDLWFPPIELPVGFGQVRRPARLPVMTMVTGYSRWLSAVLDPDPARRGPVRRLVATDRRARGGAADAGVGRRGSDRSQPRRPDRADRDCQAFRGVLGTKVIVLKPAEPEHKGIIERAHDYLERSFLPGRVFTGPDDFNTQLQGWLSQVNTRTRRALGCAPTDRIGADRQAMLTLPPVAPATGWRTSTGWRGTTTSGWTPTTTRSTPA